MPPIAEEPCMYCLLAGGCCGTGEQKAYPEDSFHWVHALPEEVHAQLLKASSGDGGVKVCSLKEGVNLNAGLSGAGERAFGSLRGCQQASDCSGVVADVLLVLALELLHKPSSVSTYSVSLYKMPLQKARSPYLRHTTHPKLPLCLNILGYIFAACPWGL